MYLSSASNDSSGSMSEVVTISFRPAATYRNLRLLAAVLTDGFPRVVRSGYSLFSCPITAHTVLPASVGMLPQARLTAATMASPDTRSPP